MGKKEKFLSMKWFTERAERAIDKVLEERINNVLEPMVIGAQFPEEVKPYITVKLINDSLTVVLRNGDVFTKPNATEKDYLKIQKCKTESEILSVIEDKEVANEVKQTKQEAERITNTITGFNKLSILKDFTVDGQTITLKGTSRTIPPLLLDKFATVVGKYFSQVEVEGIGTVETVDIGTIEKSLANDDEYQGLKNFFMWCCLNPRAEVAASLYDFLHQNGMRITKQGFFVALRNVVVVPGNGDSELVEVVSNAYNKVKAIWKKNPADYTVLRDASDSLCIVKSTDKFSDYTIIGNLQDLYLDLPNMQANRFTDNRTKTFDIRIGQVVNMPSSKCNWSTQDCATAGLHFAGHTAPYVLCGDTTVFTLHNPMKVVGIGREKGRCWEYLPFMTTTVSEANQIMNSRDFDFFQLDEEYAIRELEDLTERAKEGFTIESTKYNFNIPSMSTAEINSIVLSLGEMKNSITKRVSLID